MMRLGIDFGTSSSRAALMNGDDPKPVKDPLKHGFTFPSSIYVTERGEVLVGHAAENQRLKDPHRYQREFKRDLGRSEPFLLGDHSILPEELVAEVLKKLKEEAEKMVSGLLTDEPHLTSAVMTVPATYQEKKRDLMRQAAEKAGFNPKEIQLLDEPVAAALYHAYYLRKAGNGKTGQGLREGEILLVYDLGGGTFDAALIQKKGDGYELMAVPAGLERCGGVDFDREIFKDVKNRCPAVEGLLNGQSDDVTKRRAQAILTDFCRNVKHQLSEAQAAEDLLLLSGITSEASYRLTRDEFNQMIAPYVERMCEECRQLVKGADIEWKDVRGILLVGGSCRVPYVGERVERAFGRPVYRVDEPELAVCLGAAVYGAKGEERRQETSPSATKEAQKSSSRKKAPADTLAAEREALSQKLSSRKTALKQQLAATSPSASTSSVEVMDYTSFTPAWTGTHGNSVHALAFSPDGSLLASGGLDHVIGLWGAQSGEALGALSGHGNQVLAVAFSRDGKTLASGGFDQTVRLWNFRRWEWGLQQVFEHPNIPKIFAVAVSPDGKMLACGGSNGNICLRDAGTGAPLRALVHRATLLGYTVHGLAFSPDGKILASGGEARTAQLWDAQTGAWLRTFSGHDGYVNSVAFSPDGKTLASASNDRTVRLWDVQTGQLLQMLMGHQGWVRSVAFSPDGKTLASASNDSTVRLWNAETGRWLGTLTQHSNWVLTIAFSPDGKMLASGGSDNTVIGWRAQ
jgi:molecular chaperone DnaK (HSP70)